MRNVISKLRASSEISAPAALSAAPIGGMITSGQPSRARDGDGVEARRAAAADEHGVARVDALVDRDLLDRADHVLGRHPHDGRCRVVDREAERLADLRRDRVACGIEVEPLAPPRK